MKEYDSIRNYETALKNRARLPEGFTCSTTSLTFFPAERPVDKPLNMNLSLILADQDITSCAGVFTQNRFPGAPVIISRNRLKKPHIRGILINNKVANVCAPSGIADAEEILAHLGRLLSTSGESFFPASTGIIGWRLPVVEIKQALPRLIEKTDTGSLLDVAKAIMTTDSFPKLRSISSGNGRISAIAKGAGMIEPNMATMLVFILTDITIPGELLQELLKEAAAASFNTISIDGDQSTSDMALIFSSGKRECKSVDEFKEALFSVCKDLAEDIVRNGEGTSHVIKVTVHGNCDTSIGRGIGKAIVNSPLVKTAIFGNDPNVGRIIGAIGDFLGNNKVAIDTQQITIKMGDIDIFSEGAFLLNREKEGKLFTYLKDAQYDPAIKGYPQHNKTVDIEVEVGKGSNSCTVIGSDLSYEYVRENADYRS